VFQWYALQQRWAFGNQFLIAFPGGELLQGSRPSLQFHKGFLHPKPANNIAARIRFVETVKTVARDCNKGRIFNQFYALLAWQLGYEAGERDSDKLIQLEPMGMFLVPFAMVGAHRALQNKKELITDVALPHQDLPFLVVVNF